MRVMRGEKVMMVMEVMAVMTVIPVMAVMPVMKVRAFHGRVPFPLAAITSSPSSPSSPARCVAQCGQFIYALATSLSASRVACRWV